MKIIRLTLTSILTGMTVLGTISKVSGDTKPQVKTDAGITFIEGPTAVGPSSNRLLPLGEQTIPSLICAGMILLVLVVLIIYIRKKWR